MNYSIKSTLVRFGLVCGLCFSSSACSIDPNLNNSPNNANQSELASPQAIYALLVGLQSATGDFYSGDRSQVSSMWAWQIGAPPGLGRSQPEAWMGYTLDPTGPPDDTWKAAYKSLRIANDISSYARATRFGADSVNPQTQACVLGISQFYKAEILGEMAALFGSIPIHITDVASPQLVSQADAYAEVQNLLDSALANMKTAGTQNLAFGQDLNFGGDATKWIAPIHTLKARYFMHTHDYAKALAEANQGISSAASTVFSMYSNNVGENSPWGHWVIVEGNLRAEKAFVDSLRSEPGDKRLAQYFAPNANGHIVGYAGHGEHIAATALDSESLVPDNASTIVKYGTNDASFPLISYEENVLIKAECEARTGDLAAAVTDVNIIRTAAGLTAFASTDQNATIAQILKQKWLQLFLEGQAYHDMRRTATLYEVVKHTKTTPGNLRWIYPQSETNANPNVPTDDDALAKPLIAY